MSLKLRSIIILFVDMAKVMTYIIAYTAIDGKDRFCYNDMVKLLKKGE
jgi:hypothetical protein